MFDDHPPLMTPATPDEILEFFRDFARHENAFWGEQEIVALTHDSTVAQWFDAVYEFPPRLRTRAHLQEFADGWNRHWNMNITADEWGAVLKPANLPFRGVCELLARHAMFPRVQPVNILGRDCAPAAVFLTLRSMFARAGAPVEDLAPSTPLGDYGLRHLGRLQEVTGHLAPGVLPPISSRSRYGLFVLITFALAVAVFFLLNAGNASWDFLWIPWLVAALVLTWIAGRPLFPVHATFGDLRTFRDLSIAVAAKLQLARQRA